MRVGGTRSEMKESICRKMRFGTRVCLRDNVPERVFPNQGGCVDFKEV